MFMMFMYFFNSNELRESWDLSAASNAWNTVWPTYLQHLDTLFRLFLSSSVVDNPISNSKISTNLEQKFCEFHSILIVAAQQPRNAKNGLTKKLCGNIKHMWWLMFSVVCNSKWYREIQMMRRWVWVVGGRDATLKIIYYWFYL